MKFPLKSDDEYFKMFFQKDSNGMGVFYPWGRSGEFFLVGPELMQGLKKLILALSIIFTLFVVITITANVQGLITSDEMNYIGGLVAVLISGAYLISVYVVAKRALLKESSLDEANQSLKEAIYIIFIVLSLELLALGSAVRDISFERPGSSLLFVFMCGYTIYMSHFAWVLYKTRGHYFSRKKLIQR